MDQQKRTFLAIVICLAIGLGWSFFFAPKPEEGTPKQDADITATKKDAAGNKTGTKDPKGVSSDAKGTPVAAATPSVTIPPKTFTLGTDRFKVGVTNVGGRVAGLSYLSPEQYQKAGDLLGTFPKDSTRLPFALQFEKGKVELPEGLVYQTDEAKMVKDAQGNLTTLALIHNGPSYTISKTYSTNLKHPYTLDLNVTVTNLATEVLRDQMKLKIAAYKDPAKSKSFLDFRPSELETICFVGDDLERTVFDSLDEAKAETYKGKVHWAGISLRYFNYVSIFEQEPESCTFSRVDKDYAQTTLTFAPFALGKGEQFTSKQMLYMGPKDVDVMDTIRPDLTKTVDYGILTPLATPLRWLLNFIHGYVGNWGVAILLLTLLIKLATWPITAKSYSNAERMKLIQPQLDALRKTHENDQQRLAEETMKLFKKNKFNPLGGCLPMVLQMPILYGLYVMINNSVELYQAEFVLWYVDLSSSDPYFVLPILMGLVMVVQQRFMMTATPNPQTKIMMQLMPIMFTAFMLFLPAGLVLYYCLNLLLGVLQQWLIRRKYAKNAVVSAQTDGIIDV